jgi:hypothetical protein
MRAKTSVPPPGGKGTISLTGFDGQAFCANASDIGATAQSAKAAATRRKSRRMNISLVNQYSD